MLVQHRVFGQWSCAMSRGRLWRPVDGSRLSEPETVGAADSCLHFLSSQWELSDSFPDVSSFPSRYIVFPHSVENVNAVNIRPDSGLPVTETFSENTLFPGTSPPAPRAFHESSLPSSGSVYLQGHIFCSQ